MSRYADTYAPQNPGESLPLPVVDYRRAGCAAPRLVPVGYTGPQAHLPEADVVILTWTSAEWSALDQVLCNPEYPRAAYARDWQRSWHLFSAGAPAADPTEKTGPLWGWYQLVDIPGPSGSTVRALLFKADTHLAHPPWFGGLTTMLEQVVKESRASMIYSIGTAGGGHPSQQLGEVVITNSATIQLKNPKNANAGIDGQTFTCGGKFPQTDLMDTAVKQLMLPMSTVVTYPRLEQLVTALQQKVPTAAGLTLKDLMTPAVDPIQLHQPKVSPMAGQALLTTDYYYIADGDSPYSVLEMDDAVIAYVAGQLGVDYAFFRNVSDPVVPTTGSTGQTLDTETRSGWSSLIYTDFGLYTSHNGAIATWATLAARAG